jgi:hypothetical protein
MSIQLAYQKFIKQRLLVIDIARATNACDTTKRANDKQYKYTLLRGAEIFVAKDDHHRTIPKRI